MSQDPAPTHAIDLRRLLAKSLVPFHDLLVEAERIPVGGRLEVDAPFEPVALYAELRERGFGHTTTVEQGAVYHVTFVRVGVTAETTVAEAAARGRPVAQVLEAFGVRPGRHDALSLLAAAQLAGVESDQILSGVQRAALGLLGG
ncbi:MAG: DUF2249 domain-containing protein [Gemmatimonadales bacterium]|nr:DUF2249 domain-containing protein [Gemmatimonadales bacterium]